VASTRRPRQRRRAFHVRNKVAAGKPSRASTVDVGLRPQANS